MGLLGVFLTQESPDGTEAQIHTLFPGVFAPTLSLDQLYAAERRCGQCALFDLTDPEPLA